jgi:hypothetical protein
MHVKPWKKVNKASTPHSVDANELRKTSDFFKQDDQRRTVNELFDAAVNDLTATHELTLPSRATHWEKYHMIEAAVPEVKEAMRTLTVAWCTNYRGKRLNDRQQNAVIDAFSTIQAHVRYAQGASAA